MGIEPTNAKLIAYEARIKKGEKLSPQEDADYKQLKKQEDARKLQQGLSGGAKPDLDKGVKLQKGTPKKSSNHKTGHAVDIAKPQKYSPEVLEFRERALKALDACPGKSGGDLVECTNEELRKQESDKSPEPKTLMRGLFGGDADELLKSINDTEKAAAEKRAPKIE